METNSIFNNQPRGAIEMPEEYIVLPSLFDSRNHMIQREAWMQEGDDQ